MAAKSLREALLNALKDGKSKNYLISKKQIEILESEIRDYFAHEIIKHCGELVKGGHDHIPTRKGDSYWTIEATLIEFFKHVFKDIPAFKRSE